MNQGENIMLDCFPCFIAEALGFGIIRLKNLPNFMEWAWANIFDAILFDKLFVKLGF